MQFAFAWVAIIYFGALLLWRRFATPLPWRIAGFFYLLVLIFLFKPLTQDFVNVPADYLGTLYPWKALGVALTNGNPEINDVILQMVPWASQVREAWLSGHVPAWNFANGGGYPLLANGQSAAFSPFRLAALPLDLGRSLTCEAALKLLAALSFTFLFMRRRFSETAAVVSAVSFAFSTFIAVWLYFPHSSVVALLPALFYAIDLTIEQPTGRRTIFLALVLAAMLLAGHPESVAHSVLAAGLYTLVALKTSGGHWRRPLVALGLAGAGALLLASPFLLPFLEALPYSQRYMLLRGGSNAEQIFTRTALSSLWPLMHPDFYGLVKDRVFWGPGHAESVCGYAGVLGWIGWLALLFRWLRTRRVTPFEGYFLAAVPFFTWIALGWIGLGDLFRHLPLFGLAANGRLRFVVCWAIAVLAGMFVDRLRSDRSTALAAVGAFALVLTIAFLTSHPSAVLMRESIVLATPRLVVIGVVLAALTILPRHAVPVLLLVAVTLDLWSFAVRWNPVVHAPQLYPKTELTEMLRITIDYRHETGLARMAGLRASFFPNAAGVYGFEDIREHDPMADGRFTAALSAATGYTGSSYFGMLEHVDSPYLDLLNVRYLIGSPADKDPGGRWQRFYKSRQGSLYENRAALGRFFIPAQVAVEGDARRRMTAVLKQRDFRSAAWVGALPVPAPVRAQLVQPVVSPRAVVRGLRRTASGYEMTVDAQRWSYVASSQPFYPGWKVFRNHTEKVGVIEGNGNFVGFVVPPGRSHIEVLYRPGTLAAGLWLAALTAAAMLVAFAATGANRPRGRSATEA